ncbi:MAG: hypothetical protein JJ974_03165 [Phycisphaerales bacterium]|nr:hypothetical protein [Phycisphaerales bacterium]
MFPHLQWFLDHPILTGLAAALLFELATIFLRFGFNLSAPKVTKPLSRFTNGYRIHHGYPGLALLLLIPLFPLSQNMESLAIIIALMLAISDAFHHALILPILSGHHEFDIKYPDTSL